MSRPTFPEAPEPPFVLSSTTTISLPVTEGALGVRGIVPAPEPVASTTKVSILEIVPSGFCSQTERLPADCKSAAVSDVVHCVLDAQTVVRGVPATRIVEPGPGLDVAKLFPDAANVNSPAEPAYALDGASEEIYALPEIVTVAVADWVVSSELVATTLIKFGDGADAGAVYSPEELIDPQAPEARSRSP